MLFYVYMYAYIFLGSFLEAFTCVKKVSIDVLKAYLQGRCIARGSGRNSVLQGAKGRAELALQSRVQYNTHWSYRTVLLFLS